MASGNTALVVIDALSDELRELLRERLAAFCYGATQAAEDMSFYSYEKTIQQFLERFDSKAENTKIGMVGELLTHVMMPIAHPSLTSSAIFFNKEERGVKKGFDLTFHEIGKNTIWYGEVKSGNVASGSADQKSKSLFQIAASDLVDKLGPGALRSRWESALIDAGLTLESPQVEAVKILLRSDASELVDGALPTKNGVLSASVFHEINCCCLSAPQLRTLATELNAGGSFRNLRLIAIQENAFTDVVQFLRSEVTVDA